MNMKTTIEILKELPGGTEKTWRQEAEDRRANNSWMWMSRMIALLSRARMEELNLTQQQLAERIDCTQQNISAILSGKTNLTLDTIARLEEALHFSLIREGLEARITAEKKDVPCSSEKSSAR